MKDPDQFDMKTFAARDIPAWVAAAVTPATPATHPDPDAGPLPTPAPAATPAPIAVRASENAPAQVSGGQPSPAQGSPGQGRQTLLQNAFDAANKVLKPGGQHIKALDSDACALPEVSRHMGKTGNTLNGHNCRVSTASS